MSLYSRHFCAHIFMTSTFSWKSSSKDYCSLLIAVCEHTRAANSMHCCRDPRITPHRRRNCKLLPPGEQHSSYTDIWPKSNNGTSICREGKIITITSSNITTPRRPYSGNDNEVATVSVAGTALPINSTRTVFRTESTDSLDNVPDCRVCLAQSF